MIILLSIEYYIIFINIAFDSYLDTIDWMT